MPAQEKDQVCTILVAKITKGESLDDAEKSHFAACEGCMAEAVRRLDEEASSRGHGLGTSGGEANGDIPQTRPEAEKALEQGRRVFEREFGISLRKE